MVLQPFFAEPGGKWLMAREKRPEGTEGSAYPFTMKGETFVPAAAPVVRRGEPAPLILIAFNFGDHVLDVTGRVLSPDGEELSAARFEDLERSAEVKQIDRFMSKLTLDALEPGEYRLEVTLTDEVTGQKASSWSRFEVEGP